jgi:methylglutaconyl-CoA hydratase
MPDDPLLIHRADPAITLLTLNRPDKRNALNVALIESLHAAIATASADPQCRALIVRGAGPSFCAGLDLTEASDATLHARSAESLATLYETLGTSPLITIAAAHGAAMGGGAGILAACDFVVAADDLSLAYPEVRRGLVAALVTCLLRRQLSDRQVRELILLSASLSATEALAFGLVRQVVAPAQLEEAALDLAQKAIQGAPGAIARTKKLLDATAPRPLREDLRIAMMYHIAARESSEAAEGISAFREKRRPSWGPRPPLEE